MTPSERENEEHPPPNPCAWLFKAKVVNEVDAEREEEEEEEEDRGENLVESWNGGPLFIKQIMSPTQFS